MIGMRSSRRRPIHSGITGARCSFEFRKSGSNRNIVRRNSSGEAAAHACGEHEVGYVTGNPTSPRRAREELGKQVAEIRRRVDEASITRCASSTKPYRMSPAAHIALSCGQTLPQW